MSRDPDARGNKQPPGSNTSGERTYAAASLESTGTNEILAKPKVETQTGKQLTPPLGSILKLFSSALSTAYLANQPSRSRLPITMSAASPKIAILVGATGAVGKEVLSELLRTDEFASVHTFGRRPSGRQHAKLVDHVVDFEKLADGDEAEAKKFSEIRADTTIITLGTTRADAGSAARFERIDREYVVAAAKAARVESKEAQNLVYLCSAGANPKAPSFFILGKRQWRPGHFFFFSPITETRSAYPSACSSKGLTELGLAEVSYPSSFIFRPGFLYGAQREKPRKLEGIFGVFTHNVLSKVSSGAEIHVPLLAKSIAATAAGGKSYLETKGVKGSPLLDNGKPTTSTILSNAEAATLGK